MKKALIIIVFLYTVLFSFSSIYSQDYDLYYELIGKNREYITQNFPDAEVLPFYSDIFPGYTEIGALQFDNGGTVSILVSYNKNKNVRCVALAMFDMVNTHAPDAIYEALDYLSYLYGFQARGNIIRNSIKVTKEDDMKYQ